MQHVKKDAAYFNKHKETMGNQYQYAQNELSPLHLQTRETQVFCEV